MKLSVSLPDDDVAFLDACAARGGFPSRSVVLHRAVALLRAGDLVSAYEHAFAGWVAEGEADPWDETGADGLDPVAG